MTGVELNTTDLNIKLIPIDIERDAPKGVEWLAGKNGRDTLKKMGVADEFNHESTIDFERQRLQKISDDPNELAWMIELDGKVIGITEVYLYEFEALSGPNVHIMIGDIAARGKHVGTTTLQAVIQYLRTEMGVKTIFSRHLTDNVGSAVLLRKLGFIDHDGVYSDSDGLEWQNMILESSHA